MKKDTVSKRKERRSIAYGISLITQISISMITPIALCVVVAVIIQDRFDTLFAVPIALLLGIMAAFRNVYILTKRIYEKDMRRENEEIKYFEDLKNAPAEDE